MVLEKETAGKGEMFRKAGVPSLGDYIPNYLANCHKAEHTQANQKIYLNRWLDYLGAVGDVRQAQLRRHHATLKAHLLDGLRSRAGLYSRAIGIDAEDNAPPYVPLRYRRSQEIEQTSVISAVWRLHSCVFSPWSKAKEPLLRAQSRGWLG
jgi:hypothetical protein